MTRTVFAEGSLEYCDVEEGVGSYLKGMVPSWPVVVVAAKVVEADLSWGIRKWDVQPAPRIRKSTGSRVSIFNMRVQEGGRKIEVFVLIANVVSGLNALGSTRPTRSGSSTKGPGKSEVCNGLRTYTTLERLK